jgi:hypothetical protein
MFLILILSFPCHFAEIMEAVAALCSTLKILKWQDVAGCDRMWQDVAGCGRMWQDVAGMVKLRSLSKDRRIFSSDSGGSTSWSTDHVSYLQRLSDL